MKTIKQILSVISAAVLCAVPLVNGFSASAADTAQLKTYIVYNIAQTPDIGFFDFALNYTDDVIAERSRATSLCSGFFFSIDRTAFNQVRTTFDGCVEDVGTLMSTKFLVPMNTKSIYEKVTYSEAIIRDLNGIAISPTSITMDAVLLGDVDLNGVVNNKDAELIMNSIINPDEYKLNTKQKDAADVYSRGDGITGMDALTIQEYVQGQIAHF